MAILVWGSMNEQSHKTLHWVDMMRIAESKIRSVCIYLPELYKMSDVDGQKENAVENLIYELEIEGMYSPISIAKELCIREMFIYETSSHINMPTVNNTHSEDDQASGLKMLYISNQINTLKEGKKKKVWKNNEKYGKNRKTAF
ncbi:hypothetical protein KUTeg_021798 [Tegillarca granosa]|uniref:Uncharacterized protein n=1 Tax=Tegillarca granosa TaxID=220873 RepID=A0ABQ9E4M6_TEGGR|nr:hypothetical protein KUTeg_021798 [Tegillarca granosa]